MAAHAPAPREELAFVPTDRWVRACIGGEVAAESRVPMIVWPAGEHHAIYAFPESDLHHDRLPADKLVHWPGDPDLGSYVGVPMDAVDEWFEEDEPLTIGIRDPFHRIDALPSSRAAVVEVDGHRVATSKHPILLFETNLPVRVYFPREDVRIEALTKTETTTGCPYKGRASYYSVGDRTDVAWSYEDPFRESSTVAGYVSFLGEGVEATLDGEPVG
jgi:uncharacterized protein (DUF427 family)